MKHPADRTAGLNSELAGKIGKDYIYRETEVQPRRRNKQQPL